MIIIMSPIVDGDQSAVTVTKAISDLTGLAEPASLTGAIAVLQRGLLRIRRP